MATINYSVIIRTTGKAHEKYQRLLDSIIKLDPTPEEVIVVLPEGFDIPVERIGNETFYFSPKGMIIQRMTGIKKCKTPYALICDDDVAFPSDFVKKLYEPLEMGICGLSAGPLYSFLPRGQAKFLDFIMGNAAPAIIHKDRYVSIMKTSGYSYNDRLKNEKRYYETQSVAWTCFFADLEKIASIDFEDEYWLDSHGYSALDDQTMFYKAWLRGIKTVVVSDAVYEHLDGKTSTKGNRLPALYSLEYNRIVFWNRFILDMQTSIIQKGWSRACFWYRNCMNSLFKWISFRMGKISPEEFQMIRKGKEDAWAFIASKEYKDMPSVIK